MREVELSGLAVDGEDLVVAHFFYVLYVRLDAGEEGFEFRAGTEAP